MFDKFFAFVLRRLLAVLFFFRLRSLLLRALGFRIGARVAVHSPCILFSVKPNISIGDNVTINSNCYLDNRGLISIASNVNISHSVRIYTWGHDLNSPSMKLTSKPVRIDDHVWIFPNVLVMPGCHLYEGAVILPGSVVTRDVPAWTVYGGNPAKEVRKRSPLIDYKIDYRVWFAI